MGGHGSISPVVTLVNGAVRGGE